MKIRLATLLDLEGVSRVHYNAVHGAEPSNFYTTDILDSWGPLPTDEHRLARFRARIENVDEIFVVCESDDKSIVGYGVIVPSKNEIRSLYVDAAYKNQGIGKTILKHLESIALQHEIQTIELCASLNAQTFYLHQGYSMVELDSYRFQSGVEMQCVKMNKPIKISCKGDVLT